MIKKNKKMDGKILKFSYQYYVNIYNQMMMMV